MLLFGGSALVACDDGGGPATPADRGVDARPADAAPDAVVDARVDGGRDAAPADAARDARPSADAALDAAPPQDAAPDAGPDGSLDATPDARADAAVADGGADATSDAAPDAAPPPDVPRPPFAGEAACTPDDGCGCVLGVCAGSPPDVPAAAACGDDAPAPAELACHARPPVARTGPPQITVRGRLAPLHGAGAAAGLRVRVYDAAGFDVAPCRDAGVQAVDLAGGRALTEACVDRRADRPEILLAQAVSAPCADAAGECFTLEDVATDRWLVYRVDGPGFAPTYSVGHFVRPCIGEGATDCGADACDLRTDGRSIWAEVTLAPVPDAAWMGLPRAAGRPAVALRDAFVFGQVRDCARRPSAGATVHLARPAALPPVYYDDLAPAAEAAHTGPGGRFTVFDAPAGPQVLLARTAERVLALQPFFALPDAAVDVRVGPRQSVDPTAPVEHCANDLDDDDDGDIDCGDPACDGVCGSVERCGDGRDNDADGLSDCADASCAGALHCQRRAAAGPWSPAARTVRLDVPLDSQDARDRGCRLAGLNAGAGLRGLVQQSPDALDAFLRPDEDGVIPFVQLGWVRDWPVGRPLDELAAVDLWFFEGRQVDGGFAPAPSGFEGDDPSAPARVRFEGLSVGPGGRVAGGPSTFEVPLNLAEAQGASLSIELAQATVHGRVGAAEQGFALRDGRIEGYLSVAEIDRWIETLIALCDAPDAPARCAELRRFVLDQPVPAIRDLVLFFVGDADARLAPEGPTPCNPAIEPGCDAVSVCLFFSMDPVSVVDE